MLKHTPYTPFEMTQGLRRNEQRAFEQFYDEYAAALYGSIYRLVPNEQLAVIVLHKAFLEFHHHIREHDPGTCSAFTWALRICRDKAKSSVDLSKFTSD